jgi:hypothetical protein
MYVNAKNNLLKLSQDLGKEEWGRRVEGEKFKYDIFDKL